MATGVQKAWSTTANSNGNADANVGMAENQTPASLNDGVRAVMAGVKGWANQLGAAKTTGGSANAQTLTSDSVAAISTAYAAGMIFCVKAGYTNTTTTPTFNVDGVGAKTIKKGGAQAALAVGDITAGGIYWIAYEASGDCFLLLNPDSGPVSHQPLDATLTALAALSWSSGNPLVQFTAADTVSLTLTPSVSSISTSQGAAATTPSATFVNTTDNASVRVLRVEGDRATPTAGDVAYMSWYMSDSAGNQDEFGRIELIASAVTNGSEEGRFRFSVMNTSGVLTQKYTLTASGWYPTANDGGSLGISGNSWADLFMASGAVLNFAAGNYTLTHSSGTLEASGTFRARIPLSSETGTPTSASANKKMVLTGGATINTGTADDFYLLDPGTSARTITRGSGMTMYLNGVDSATATLAANQLGSVHYRSASVVVLSGAFS